jgi:phage recombination protein Bet
MTTQLCLQQLDRDKIELLKTTICRGATDDELKLFIHACNQAGLDPFMRQIHAVKRWDSSAKREVMAIQVGIDGYRLIAERTGRYAPGPEPTFAYDKDNKLVSATAYVKKLTADGTWHTVSASAFFSEYCQRNKDGLPIAMWKNMPHGQLAKCAESQALRKSFPAELSGLYTKEEMEQAENHMVSTMPIDPPINSEQVKELENLMYDDAEGLAKLLAWAQVQSLEQVTVSRFSSMYAACKRRAESRAKEEMELTLQPQATGEVSSV